MAVKTIDGYRCGYCGKLYIDATKADVCKEQHELIYVPLSITDLNRLVQFLHTKNDDLLTESLVSTLDRYLRGN